MDTIQLTGSYRYVIELDGEQQCYIHFNHSSSKLPLQWICHAPQPSKRVNFNNRFSLVVVLVQPRVKRVKRDSILEFIKNTCYMISSTKKTTSPVSRVWQKYDFLLFMQLVKLLDKELNELLQMVGRKLLQSKKDKIQRENIHLSLYLHHSDF